MNRRNFVQSGLLWGSAGLLSSCLPQGSSTVNHSFVNWHEVARQFPISETVPTNLNTGSAGNRPYYVEEAYHEALKLVNRKPAYQQWETWQAIHEAVLRQLGEELGLTPGNIAWTRNTTDSLQMILGALKLYPGDSLYYTVTDYPYAVANLRNRALYEGRPLIELRVQADWSDDKIIDYYLDQVEEGVLLLTSMPHQTGRILPVSGIARAFAQKNKNCRIVVDGAHVMGHFPIDLSDGSVHGFASSLHKWMSAPLGTGMMYVHPDLELQYPLRTAAAITDDRSRQWGATGTIDFAKIVGVAAALEWNQKIGGTETKWERLCYLAEYVADALQTTRGVEVILPEHHGALIGLRSLQMEAKEFQQALAHKGFHVKVTHDPRFDKRHVRLSMNLHLTETHLDCLVTAINELHS